MRKQLKSKEIINKENGIKKLSNGNDSVKYSLSTKIEKSLNNKHSKEEILVILNLDNRFNSKNYDKESTINEIGKIIISELNSKGSKLPLKLLINTYLSKFRGYEISNEDEVIHYSRLFGGPIFSHKNSNENYLDLLNRLFIEGKSFESNLNGVLKTIRKRERDRVKYRDAADFVKLSTAVSKYLETKNVSVNGDSLNVIGEFILYDEELKGIIKVDEVTDSNIKEVVSRLDRIKTLLNGFDNLNKKSDVSSDKDNNEDLSSESIAKREISTAENEVAVTVVERPIESPVKSPVEERVTVEQMSVVNKPEEKTLLEIEKEVDRYGVLEKLRGLSVKLQDKYKVQDFEHLKLMISILDKIQESVNKKPNHNILYVYNKAYNEIIIDLKYEGKMERLYITPAFFVNLTMLRVYADRTKVIKMKSRNRISPVEKSFAVLIKLLIRLVKGRREKDRMSKNYKESDIRRLKRADYILFKLRKVEENEPFKLGKVKDKNGTDLITYESNEGGRYVISPDFIYDVDGKTYLYRRKNVHSTTVSLLRHAKENRSNYKMSTKEYNRLMMRLLQSWDIRRKLIDRKGNIVRDENGKAL